jgi:UDP-N-acetylmuramoyl-L-alanyl-D-glutamate--2,6-diaminopimelate ligase
VVGNGVAALGATPGRMEQIHEGQAYNVVVDYAHAPDALKNVLKTLQEVTKGRVIVVFGATGDRDKLKRPIMGEIAAKNADVIYLTDDETYTEDPDAIRAAVMEGIKKGKGTAKTTEIGDRKEAIKAAFKEAKKGDVVLLAGLGHQDYRAMGGKKMPWDERQVARKLLNKK